MKKSLIALAAMAVTGVASAQSSVTLFGVVDACYTHGSGSTSNNTSLGNSCYNSSRLGFRGTEDLGGGMSASFWLEAALANDNGQSGATNATNQAAAAALGNGQQGLTFARRSTVSLAGGFGEIRLGRDYTPTFWNDTVFDPFGTNGVGTNVISSVRGTTGAGAITVGAAARNATYARASNSIGYFLPGNLGGFYGQAMYAMGENNSGAATSDDGRYVGARVGFANGPINVAAAFGKVRNSVSGDVSSNNFGASYDLGVAQLMGEYASDKTTLAGAETKLTGYLIGGLVPMGAGQIRAAYSTAKVKTAAGSVGAAKKFALGYVHNLSKRTAVYATYARLSNSDGAALALNSAVTPANGSSSGYDFGIRHSF